jgi:hypothetical protein
VFGAGVGGIGNRNPVPVHAHGARRSVGVYGCSARALAASATGTRFLSMRTAAARAKMAELDLFCVVLKTIARAHRRSGALTLTSTSLAKTFLAIAVVVIAASAQALDKNGQFSSIAEQDAHIAATLRAMAKELNQQTPIQLDDDTRLLSVIALQKTITFNYELTRVASGAVSIRKLEQVASENQNRIACGNKATRDLVDLGVRYAYVYTGSDGKYITRVVLSSYRC